VVGDVVNSADVRVRDPAGGGDLLAEASEAVWVCGEVLGEELEGDRLAKGEVVGPVHLTHATLAEALPDLVAIVDDGAVP
jgi:hypothetical protein